MRRRDCIWVFVAAAVLPLGAVAQQKDTSVVGYIGAAFAKPSAGRMDNLRRGLREAGYEAGRNLTIDYRWAENDLKRIPGFTQDLVRRGAKVIIADGTRVLLETRRVRHATPVVFLIGTDPVKRGFVASLNRPGGTMTGLTFQNTELVQKRAALLDEILPKIGSIAFLGNPKNPNLEINKGEMRKVAQIKGLKLHFFEISRESDFDAVFREIVLHRPVKLVVQADPFLDARHRRVTELAAQYSIPASYQWREIAESGGLMSYGVDLSHVYRQLGGLAGQILKGVKPANLPVERPTKFDFVLNLKTAKALGITFPPSILLRADEVIE